MGIHSLSLCLLAIGFLAHVSTASGSSSFKPNPTEEEIKSALPPGWTTGLDEQGVRVYWKIPQYNEDDGDQKASDEDQSPQRQYYLHPRVMKAQKLYNDRRVLRRRAARAARPRVCDKLYNPMKAQTSQMTGLKEWDPKELKSSFINPRKPGYHPNPSHQKPVGLRPRPEMRYRPDANTGP